MELTDPAVVERAKIVAARYPRNMPIWRRPTPGMLLDEARSELLCEARQREELERERIRYARERRRIAILPTPDPDLSTGTPDDRGEHLRPW
jgi:hypothetical protein